MIVSTLFQCGHERCGFKFGQFRDQDYIILDNDAIELSDDFVIISAKISQSQDETIVIADGTELKFGYVYQFSKKRCYRFGMSLHLRGVVSGPYFSTGWGRKGCVEHYFTDAYKCTDHMYVNILRHLLDKKELADSENVNPLKEFVYFYLFKKKSPYNIHKIMKDRPFCFDIITEDAVTTALQELEQDGIVKVYPSWSVVQ